MKIPTTSTFPSYANRYHLFHHRKYIAVHRCYNFVASTGTDGVEIKKRSQKNYYSTRQSLQSSSTWTKNAVSLTSYGDGKNQNNVKCWTMHQQRRSYKVLGEVTPGGGFKSYDKSIHPDVAAPRNKKKQQQQATNSKHRKERGQFRYKFVDRARIQARGGEGGNGCLSYYRYMNGKRRPNGGHGGNGGAVILVADPNEQTLGHFSTHHFKGQSGTHGTSNNANGRKGRNTVVRVPCGVVVHRVLQYYEEWNDETQTVQIKPEYQEQFDAFEESLYRATHPDEDEGEEEEDFRTLPRSRMTRRQREIVDMERSQQEEEEDDDDDYEVEGNIEDDNAQEEEAELDKGIWRRGPDGLYDTSFLSSKFNPYREFYQQPLLSGKLRDDMEDAMHAQHNEIPYEERERVTIADLDQPGSYVVLARGGRGGRGNGVDAKFRHSPARERRATVLAKSQPGDEAFLELELKMIADIGLVGFPNAGKSSLLAAMSKAKPEIASYPFTTLHPLVGMIEYRDGFRVSAADIPGLIEGAHAGRGRGIDFLRHLERTKALLYIVDVAGVDGRDPMNDLMVLTKELESYGDGELMERDALLVANKLDLIPNEEERESLLFELESLAEQLGIQIYKEITNEQQRRQQQIFGISAGVTGEGLQELSREIRSVVLHCQEKQKLEQWKQDDILFAS